MVAAHHETARRLAGAGACASGVAAGTGLVAAGAGRYPGRYLSELGVPGSPDAWLYQASVWSAALGLALVAVTVWLADQRGSGPEPHRLVPPLLGAGAALLATSAAVSCSPGCPLPPYDRGVTAGDLVHAGAAAAGFAVAVGGILLLAAGSADPVVRRLCRVAGTVVAVLIGLTGVMMLAVGRGMVNGVLERAATAVALVWLVAVGARFSRPARRVPARGMADPAEAEG